jgi:hypothetical protein
VLLLTHPAFIYSKKIEDVSELHEEYIRSLHSMQMERFESDIWHKFGHKFIAETDRRKVVYILVYVLMVPAYCFLIAYNFSALSFIIWNIDIYLFSTYDVSIYLILSNNPSVETDRTDVVLLFILNLLNNHNSQ